MDPGFSFLKISLCGVLFGLALSKDNEYIVKCIFCESNLFSSGVADMN